MPNDKPQRSAFHEPSTRLYGALQVDVETAQGPWLCGEEACRIPLTYKAGFLRHIRSTGARVAVLLGAVIVSGLVSCAPEPEQVPAEVVPVTTETPTPAPTPTEEPTGPLVLPECGGLVDLETLAAETGFTWEHTVPESPENYHGYRSAMGPKALEVLENSDQYVYCVFIITGTNGEQAVEILAAELDDYARDSLIGDLRASDYIEAEREDGVVAFDYEYGLSYGDPAEIRYLFSDNAWVTAMARENRATAELALEGLRSANPQLP